MQSHEACQHGKNILKIKVTSKIFSKGEHAMRLTRKQDEGGMMIQLHNGYDLFQAAAQHINNHPE
jgi:hypothetical protein